MSHALENLIWMPMPDRPRSMIQPIGLLIKTQAIINGTSYALIESDRSHGLVRVVVRRPLWAQSWAYLTHPIDIAVNLSGLMGTRANVVVTDRNGTLEYPSLIITAVEEHLAVGQIRIYGEACKPGFVPPAVCR